MTTEAMINTVVKNEQPDIPSRSVGLTALRLLVVAEAFAWIASAERLFSRMRSASFHSLAFFSRSLCERAAAFAACLRFFSSSLFDESRLLSPCAHCLSLPAIAALGHHQRKCCSSMLPNDLRYSLLIPTLKITKDDALFHGEPLNSLALRANSSNRSKTRGVQQSAMIASRARFISWIKK